MKYLTSSSIAQAKPVIARLKTCPYLESASLGRQLDQVNCIAMPKSSRVKSLSIVIYNHLPIDNLVLSIEVDICDA